MTGPSTDTETGLPVRTPARPIRRAFTLERRPSGPTSTVTSMSWPKYWHSVTRPARAGAGPGAAQPHLFRPDQDRHRLAVRHRGRRRREGQPAQHRQDRAARPRALQDVGVADELGQRRVERVGIEVLGGGPLRHPAVAQHRHPLGQGQGLVLVVGHQHRCGPGLGQHPGDVGAHPGPQSGVERGEGLVEQDEGGLSGQGPGQGHPLLHAPRELVGIKVPRALQTHEAEQFGHSAVLSPPPGQPEGDVAGGVQMRKERTVLGDVADPAGLGRDVGALPFDQDFAQGHRPRARPFETGQDAQQRRLAATGRSEHGRERALGHLEVDPVQDHMLTKGLCQPGDDDPGQGAARCRRSNHRPRRYVGTTATPSMAAAKGAAAP